MQHSSPTAVSTVDQLYVGVYGGDGGASRQQWSVLQSTEQLNGAPLTDGSVDSRLAAGTCVDICGDGGGASRQ